MLARLPSWPPCVAFTIGLNALLLPQLDQGVRQALLNRHLRIEVRDARLRLDFRLNARGFMPAPAGGKADLSISAASPDFLQLARREVDADTLFFGRKLSMQGDTELGVLVKNTLDALEAPVFDAARWRRRT